MNISTQDQILIGSVIFALLAFPILLVIKSKARGAQPTGTKPSAIPPLPAKKAGGEPQNRDVTAFFIIVDAPLMAALQRQGENLESWGLEMAQKLAGPHWAALQAWMRRTNNSVSIAMMGGIWDRSRIGDVVVDQFGHLGVVVPGVAMTTNSSRVGPGNVGLAITYNK